VKIGASATRRRAVAIVVTVAACAALGVALALHSDDFTTALNAAPLPLLALVAALQLVALLARTEAWYVCVRATGATAPRRRLYRASSVGSVAVVINGQIGLAARLAVLRRSCPRESPRVRRCWPPSCRSSPPRPRSPRCSRSRWWGRWDCRGGCRWRRSP